MSEADWTEKLAERLARGVESQATPDGQIEAIRKVIDEAYADHVAALDVDKLAERIAEAAIYPAVITGTLPPSSQNKAMDAAVSVRRMSVEYTKRHITTVLATLLERDRQQRELLRECRPWIDRKHSTHHDHCGCSLLARIDALA